jgi:hypothetical protein
VCALTDFSADQNGIKGLAGFSRQRAADVRSAVANLNKLPAPSDDILGDAGATGADRDFLAAWVDELNIVAGGLDEIGQKFEDSARDYDTTDVHWSHKFQGVAS